jgi:hypothetical protein
MSDQAARERALHLRRLAALEITHHRETEGLRGAALDGSLAMGAVWPSSDLDFMIVPLAEAERQQGVVWGEREGIVWHKHFNGAQLLRELVDGYPGSFIRPAEGPYGPDANWLLDGLVVMEIAEDPEGLLAETKEFVTARRFAGEVWKGRRTALLQELRRVRDEARGALEKGEAGAAYAMMGKLTGFAALAGQIWLEAAHRIYSSKEQDGTLAEITRAAGHADAHDLYRSSLAVDPERAAEASPLLLDLGDWGAAFYDALGAQVPEDARRASGPVLAAWVRHLSHTLSLAPSMGHPAYLYQRLETLRYWVAERPAELLTRLRAQTAPELGTLETANSRLALLLEEVEDLLLGTTSPEVRAAESLAAADALLELTERAV